MYSTVQKYCSELGISSGTSFVDNKKRKLKEYLLEKIFCKSVKDRLINKNKKKVHKK
jgi:hypothetical protein